MTNWTSKFGGSNFYKLQEGENRFVLLTESETLPLVYTGKYRHARDGEQASVFREVCYILVGDKIQEAELPYSIAKKIAALMDEVGVSEVPLMYEVVVTATGAGTKEVIYNVRLGEVVKVPQTTLDELAALPSPKELVAQRKERDAAGITQVGQTEQDFAAPTKPAYPTVEISPDDIPF